MSTESKSLITGFLAAVMLVALVAFAGAMVHASGGPSKADYEALNHIKQNQTIIAKNREAYTLFMKAKQDNADQIKFLGQDGYTVKWDTLSLVPWSF